MALTEENVSAGSDSTAQPERVVIPGSRGRTVRRNLLRYAPLVIVGAVLVYLVLVPIIVLLWSSFKNDGQLSSEGFTLSNYIDVYTNGAMYSLLANTLIFAAGSTVVAVVLGSALAWLIERTDLPGRDFMRGVAIVPLALPPLLLGVSWILLLDPNIGALNVMLGKASIGPLNIYSMWGMILLEGLTFVPTTYLMLAPAFRSIDATVEEAALTSGAGPWLIIRRIIIPLVTPAILAVSSFLFIASLLLFDIPGLIGLRAGIHVLASEVFIATQPQSGLPDYGTVSAIASIPLIALLGLTWVYHHFTKQSHRYVVVGGKGRRGRPFQLGKLRWPCVVGVWTYFVIGIIAPFTALAIVSLFPYYSGISVDSFQRLTTANYTKLFDNDAAFSSAWHSIIIALVVATFLMLFAPFVSWIVTKSDLRGRAALDALAFMPIGIPAVMIGVALIFLYVQFKPLSVYGTIWIIVIAHVTTFLAFSTRTTNGALMQLAPELEEAARTSGATRLLAYRRIVMPLVRPAMLIVWVWVAAHSTRELSSALLLQGFENQTFTTVLWDYWQNGEPTVMAAGGVLLTALLVALVFVWNHFRSPDDEY